MSKIKASPWQLLKQSFRDYRQHWALLIGIMLIVSLPVALLAALGVVDTSTDTTTSAYVGFAQVAMNAAVIYAIVRIVHRVEILPTIRQSYYRGSAAIVRLFLVSVLLVSMLLFLLLGLFIVVTGVVAPDTPLQIGEQVLLSGLALAIAVPSLWLLPRSLWAIYLIFESGVGPAQAVKASWKLTVGRTWSSLGHLAALGIFLLLLLALPVICLVVLQASTRWPIWEPVLQLVATFIVVPVSNLYLYRYLRTLQD